MVSSNMEADDKGNPQDHFKAVGLRKEVSVQAVQKTGITVRGCRDFRQEEYALRCGLAEFQMPMEIQQEIPLGRQSSGD